jgi:hypothetical protein
MDSDSGVAGARWSQQRVVRCWLTAGRVSRDRMENGWWAPSEPTEKLLVATIDHRRVLEERQNFDPSGHYGRADVTRLKVNRKRQNVIDLLD